jgi:DNA gyrase/topoisomerase IV subunit B
MITAFGTGIGEEFDLEKLRYHKIVLMADADVDGQHITTLLLTLIFRYMKPLIEHGYVYLGHPAALPASSGRTRRTSSRTRTRSATVCSRPDGPRASDCPRTSRSSATRVWAR